MYKLLFSIVSKSHPSGLLNINKKSRLLFAFIKPPKFGLNAICPKLIKYLVASPHTGILK